MVGVPASVRVIVVSLVSNDRLDRAAATLAAVSLMLKPVTELLACRPAAAETG